LLNDAYQFVRDIGYEQIRSKFEQDFSLSELWPS